ncbi:hypothetical protein M5K25_017434 [Dendrobium thyrsiflorum]|uniref:Uncharacterized protein n=1 Tax=Dendrobium thyrsiflorum TaxID=117978 RepID=A0ABD0UMD3_DENTH
MRYLCELRNRNSLRRRKRWNMIGEAEIWAPFLERVIRLSSIGIDGYANAILDGEGVDGRNRGFRERRNRRMR